MFFAALDRLRRGSARLRVRRHRPDPAHVLALPRGGSSGGARHASTASTSDAIRELYKHNDALVGRVMEQLRRRRRADGAVRPRLQLVPPRREPERWLQREGYLALKDGRRRHARVAARRRLVADPGLLPRPDRHVPEPRGPRAARASSRRAPRRTALKAEIIGKLNGLRDEEKDEVGIREVFDTATLYSGPYLENAPDLLIGYNAGYRTSWDCATGVVAGPVFEDNVKAWSGDHCIDPRLVPGVFFCNRTIDAEEPALIDIAPTALRLFGVEPPAYMDGTPRFDGGWHERCRTRMARSSDRSLRSLRRCLRWRRACGGTPATGRRVIVLGFDGLDYQLTRDLMARGPHAELSRGSRRSGSFAPLGTSIPPQSPGRVVDLHHRPRSRRARHLRFHPSRSEDARCRTCRRRRPKPAARSLTIGKWQFPLTGGTRRAAAARAAVLGACSRSAASTTTIIRMPANFPPSGTATRELSGMGTPDILGTYGTFSFFTSEPFAFGGRLALRRRRRTRSTSRTASCARRSRGRTIRSSSKPEKVRASSPRISTPAASSRSSSSATKSGCCGRRVERLGAGRVRADRRSQTPARRCAGST